MKVKQLEWIDKEYRSISKTYEQKGKSEDYWFGYGISKYTDKFVCEICCPGISLSLPNECEFPTLKESKTAAQQHFEKWILSQIEID